MPYPPVRRSRSRASAPSLYTMSMPTTWLRPFGSRSSRTRRWGVDQLVGAPEAEPHPFRDAGRYLIIADMACLIGP
jgi:hypothetical protein